MCCDDSLEMWLLLGLLAVGTAANIDCKFSLFIIIIIITSQSSKQKQTHGRKSRRFYSTVTHIQGDAKKRELLKNSTKIEEIQEKKNY